MTESAIAAIKAAASPDELSRQIEALRTDLVTLTRAVSADVAGGLGKAGRRIGATGEEVRQGAGRTVAAHPLAALGLAAFAGLLLGLLARRA